MTASSSVPADSSFPDEPGIDSTTRPTAPQDDGARMSRHDFTIIALLLVSTFVVILNETVMGLALPRLMDSLGISAARGQWLTTAFMLTMAVVIPITGFLIRRVATRTLFILAMSLFSVGTVICAAAPGLTVLVVGRIVQATGTAIMMPLLMTTALTLVPMQQRGRVMGNISIVISVAPAIGPVVSGAILSVLSWRWIFIFVTPIALAALAVGALLMKNVGETTRARIDYGSVVLSALAFGGLVYGLSRLGEVSSGTPVGLPLGSLAVGVLALLAFGVRQVRLQRDDAALLDLRTFEFRSFRLAVVMLGVNMMALFGTIILLPLYLQHVLALDPLTTGLMMLPGGIVMGVAAPFVGRAYDRIGPRPLLVPGAVLVTLAFLGLGSFGQTTPVWLFVTVYLVMNLGLALTFTPLFTVGLGALPPHLYSYGSATVSTAQQVFGAAGTALSVTIATAVQTSLVRTGADPIAAEAQGMRWAFLAGALLSLIPLGLAFVIRREDPEPEGEAVEVPEAV